MKSIITSILLALALLPLIAHDVSISVKSKLITDDLHSWTCYKTIPYDEYFNQQNPFKINDLWTSGQVQLLDDSKRILWTKNLRIGWHLFSCLFGDDYNVASHLVENDGSSAFISEDWKRTIIINKSGKEYPLPMYTGTFYSLGKFFDKFWLFYEDEGSKYDQWQNVWADTLYFYGESGVLITDTTGVILKQVLLPRDHYHCYPSAIDKQATLLTYSYHDSNWRTGYALINMDGNVIYQKLGKKYIHGNLTKLSEDGKLCMFVYGETCEIIETSSGKTIFSINHMGTFGDLSNQQYGIMISSHKSKLSIIDYKNLRCLGRIDLPRRTTLTDLWMSPDGKDIRIITGDKKYRDKEVRYYHMD